MRIEVLRWMAFAIALSALLACITDSMVYDLCTDSANCSSASDCPDEPPRDGKDCDLADGSECYYCTERNRVDAHFYVCDGGTWDRQPSTDCN